MRNTRRAFVDAMRVKTRSAQRAQRIDVPGCIKTNAIVCINSARSEGAGAAADQSMKLTVRAELQTLRKFPTAQMNLECTNPRSPKRSICYGIIASRTLLFGSGVVN